MEEYKPKKSGAKALIVCKGKILLYKRDNKPTIPYPDHWDFIGGGVEGNESFEEALIREINEEIGVNPDEIYFIGKRAYGDRLAYRYICKINNNTYDKIRWGEEGQDFRLFTLEEIRDLKLVPAYRDFILLNEGQLRAFLSGSDLDPSMIKMEDTAGK